MEEYTVQNIAQALRLVFGEHVDSGRFIDTTKIPFICKDIEKISATLIALDKKLDEKFVTKERFTPIERVVYGAVGLILAAFVTKLLNLW